jgi:CheY-like chemotaxis protein
MNESIAALESHFNAVLDVSRLDAGAVEAKVQPVALQPLFDRVGQDMAAAADEKGLALRLVPTRLAVRSDPVLLERIVRNLVANAIRYTANGAVLMGVRRRDGRLAIEVRDSGIGIAPADQESVFEEFYQVGNVERDRRQGMGLGLSIVRRLALLMGHEVTLTSSPGRGSTFAVVLDAAPAPEAEAAAGVEPKQALAGMRVVVVDDEPDVRDGMAALLRTWGCEPLTYPTPGDALDDPRSARPDAVILDYRLESGTVGVDAAATLRAAWGRDVPIVLISGESSAEELARIRASGLPLLHKPVPPAKLRSLLAWLRAAASGSPRA